MRTASFVKPSFALLAILILLPVSSGSLSGQRTCCAGDEWLKWSATERNTYVYGYTAGFGHGLIEGCKRGTRDMRVTVERVADLPLNKCMETQPKFADADYLVKSVTDFYERYPDFRDIYPFEVLDQLGTGLSVDEIQKASFFRHKPAN
jgi:hypothetical protein